MSHTMLRAAAAGLAGRGGRAGRLRRATATTAATGGGQRRDVAAAKAAVAEYTGKPTAFPVDTPLKTKPDGKTFAYLQCSTPACALFAQIAGADAGAARLPAQGRQGRPGGQRGAERDGLDRLAQARRRAAAGGRPEPVPPADAAAAQDEASRSARTGSSTRRSTAFEADFINNDTDELAGKLMADWAVAQGGGEVAFYGVPELSFTPIMQRRLRPLRWRPSARRARCATSTSRSARSARALRARVVSDLQSHPNTKVAVFATAEAGTGLPAALKAARLEVEADGLGSAAGDPRLHQGGPVGRRRSASTPSRCSGPRSTRWRGWSAGEPLTEGQKKGLPPIQFLTQEDITFDPTQGWQALPRLRRSASRSCGGPRHEARVLPRRRRRAAGGRRRRRDRRPRRRRPCAATRRWPSCSDRVRGPGASVRSRSRARTGCRSAACGSRRPCSRASSSRSASTTPTTWPSRAADRPST